MADEGDDGGPPLGGADELPRGLEAAPEGGDATAQEEEPAAKGAEESGPEETPAEGADISAPEEPLEGIGGVEPEEPPAHSPEALTAEESPEKWAEAVVLEDPSAEEVEHIHPDPPLEEGGASKIDEGTSRGSLGELQNEGEAEAKPEAESPFRDEPPQRHDRELGDPEELQDKAQAAAEEEIAAQEENTPTEVAEADGTEEGADGEAGEAREDDALAKDPVALGDERAGGDEAAAEKGERSLVHDGLEGETSKQLGSLQDCVEAKNGDGPEAEAAKEAEAQAQVTGGERLTSWSAGAMHFDDGTKGDSRQAEDKQEKKKKKKGKKGKKEQKEELPEFPSPSSWDVNFPGAQQQQREGLSNMPQSHEFGPSSPSSSSSSSSSSARVSPPPHHQGVSPWRQPSMPRRPGSAMAALGATSRGPLTRIAAGSGAMAVRGRLAAATSREAVFKQEAEMAGADLDIMREEMAELQAQLDQEAMLRRQMEEELELALGELETERANPYKEKWQQAEAMLKVAQAQVASLEEKLKQLQIDAARDRAVAEVAERKREDSERKRESAERRAADLERSNSGAAKDFTRGNPPGERPSSRAYGSRRRPSRYDDPFAAVGWEGVPSYNPSYAPQPPPQPQAPQQSEEVHLLRGALEQAQRTNTALVNAELRRSGLLEDPQDAMERRLRKLEQAMTSPLGSPVRSRMLGGPMNPLDGGLSMLGGQPSSGLMGGGFPYAYGAAPVMIIPPASPSARMAGALAQMDWQANAMGGGGGYGAVNPQQPGYFTPQGPNGAMPPHMPYTPGQQHHRGYGPPSPGYGYADAYRDQRSSTSAEPSTPYSGYGNVPHPEMSSADRFQRSLQSSTAAVPAEPDWSLEQIHRVPQVPRNTNPNQMHEEALRAARIQYHDEKKRMMELQLARQRQAAAS